MALHFKCFDNYKKRFEGAEFLEINGHSEIQISK